MDIPEIPAEKLKQFRGVMCWMAHLYKYCLNERPHLNTDEGKAVVEESKFKTTSADFANEVNLAHWYIVAFMLRFNELRWSLKEITFTRLKLPDHILLSLTKHRGFEDQSIDDVIKKGFTLTSRERKVLQEFALRLTP